MTENSENNQGSSASSTKRKRPQWSLRIKEARSKIGLSQAELATKIGSSQSTIGDYEAGRSEPSLSVFFKIAHACDVSHAWLILGSGTVSESPSKKMSFEQSLRYFEDDADLSDMAHAIYMMLVEEKFPTDFEFVIVVARRLLNEVMTDSDYEGTLTKEMIERQINRERFRVRRFFHQARIEMMSRPPTAFIA